MPRNKKSEARAKLRVRFKSTRQLIAITRALEPELAHPAGEKARARIVKHGKSMIVHFEAKDSASLRAILSSYLRVLAASFKVTSELSEFERSRRDENR